ncbi:hypothetical protein [Chitinophaga caseinilytica]|uniref:hypothetical protein n=1 Tax=Chitinophaga caseinilytica TaxID=2267521 RepID=UPI003C2CE8F1
MKKFVLLPLIALVLVTYFACTKNEAPFTPESFKDPFVSEAANFVKGQVSTSEFESLDLQGYSLMKKNEKEVIGVRFNVKGKDGKQFAVVGKTASGLTGNWVDVSELDANASKNGTLATRSFSGDKRSNVSFTEGRVTKVNSTVNGKSKTTVLRYGPNGERLKTSTGARISGPDSEEGIWLPEVTVYGYYNNYSVSYFSLFYYFNQSPSYTYTYQTTDPYIYGYGGGGGGGSSTAVVELAPVEILSGPSVDLNKRINCFGNVPTNASTTYSMTVYTDIPEDGNPTTVLYGTNPGHAFVTLTKTNGSTSVSQTFGFYPANGLKSITFDNVTSKIVNDASHEYNAKITIPSMTEAQFNNATSTALTKSGNSYDLNDYNCTDYAVDIFNSVSVPGFSPLSIPDHVAPAGVNYKTTPGGLYKALNQLKTAGGSMAPYITVGVDANGGASGGECN